MVSKSRIISAILVLVVVLLAYVLIQYSIEDDSNSESCFTGFVDGMSPDEVAELMETPLLML